MLTYAIGDIHGYYYTTMRLLEKIKLDKQEQVGDGPARIIFLGDYVDRGPQSKQVIELIRSKPLEAHGFEQIALMGNHEQLMTDALDSTTRGIYDPWGIWMQNGGNTTIDSYGEEIPREHYDWLKSLPVCFKENEWFFVHGGVSLHDHEPEKQPTDILLWARISTKEKEGYPYRIVHGHTPHRSPEVHPLRINVDTGSFYTGVITAVVIDTDEPKEQEPRFIDSDT